jgi:hypothetical protein
MITENGKLEIFENFRVDRDLPKHKKKRRRRGSSYDEMASKAGPVVDDGDDGEEMSDSEMMVGLEDSSILIDQDFTITNGTISRRSPRRRWGIWGKFLRVFSREKKISAVALDRFFRSLKDSRVQVELVEHRTVGYVRAIKGARDRGQRALLEKLVAGLAAVRSETQLVSMGLSTYLTEDAVVRFARKVDRGLRLDWLANFTRVIPDDVAVKKDEADQRCIFDNYVVLHYDPTGKNWSETAAEREKRRDPILFGVVQGRRLLYFVGDWVDVYCDLTLDKVADVLGRQVLGEISSTVEVERRQE